MFFGSLTRDVQHGEVDAQRDGDQRGLVRRRQPFEKNRKVVLNLGAGESNDEVKQQRIAALSAWKTQPVFKRD